MPALPAGIINLPVLPAGGTESRKYYFTTKRLHEQYRVSSGHYRWLYCPLVAEGSIKFSVLPAGMIFRFCHELLHQFS